MPVGEASQETEADPARGGACSFLDLRFSVHGDDEPSLQECAGAEADEERGVEALHVDDPCTAHVDRQVP